MPELPPPAVLAYYRAMGMDAFLGLFGWEFVRGNHHTLIYSVPTKDFKTGLDLWNFCKLIGIELRPVEREDLFEFGKDQSLGYPGDLRYELYINRQPGDFR